jgi:hypothetical protein
VDVLTEFRIGLELLLDSEQPRVEAARVVIRWLWYQAALSAVAIDVVVVVVRKEIFGVAAVSEDALDVVVLWLWLVMK